MIITSSLYLSSQYTQPPIVPVPFLIEGGFSKISKWNLDQRSYQMRNFIEVQNMMVWQFIWKERFVLILDWICMFYITAYCLSIISKSAMPRWVIWNSFWSFISINPLFCKIRIAWLKYVWTALVLTCNDGLDTQGVLTIRSLFNFLMIATAVLLRSSLIPPTFPKIDIQSV